MKNYTKISFFLLFTFIILFLFDQTQTLNKKLNKKKLKKIFNKKVVPIKMTNVKVVRKNIDSEEFRDAFFEYVQNKAKEMEIIEKEKNLNLFIETLKQKYDMDLSSLRNTKLHGFDDQVMFTKDDGKLETELSTESNLDNSSQNFFKTDIDKNSNTNLYQSNNKKTNMCVENAESLSNKEYLKKFSESECSPVIISPGIFSTKLVAEINCEVMFKKSPDIFKVCGWSSCEKSMLKKSPESEYVIWIPDILEGLNLLSANQKRNDCWVNIFSTPYNFDALKNNQPDEEIFIDVWEEKGWRVKIFGDTPHSKQNSKCGSSAIEYILPYNLATDSMGGTKDLLIKLRSLGYRDGLSLQSLPYDFRYAAGLNKGFKRALKKSLYRLKRLTGKKTILINHSFGTVNTYSSLVEFSNKEKENLVDFWVPIGGPLMGSSLLASTLVTGKNSLSLLDGLIGLNKAQSLEVFYNTSFSFDMMPFNYWKFAKEKWFKSFVLGRTISEMMPSLIETPRPSFFPSPKLECYKGLMNSPMNCDFLGGVFPEKNIITNGKRGYKLDEMPEFLEDLEKQKHPDREPIFKKIFEYSRGNFRDYPNPNVPVVGFMFNTRPTHSDAVFDIEEFNHMLPAKESKISHFGGDNTVETWSMYIPMLKWAYEYSYTENKGQRPIKFLDLCSSINRKETPFDNNFDYKYNFRKNEYIGTDCSCYLNPKSSACTHADEFKQPGFLSMIGKLVFTKQKAEDSYIKRWKEFEEEVLEEDLKECKHIFNAQRKPYKKNIITVIDV